MLHRALVTGAALVALSGVAAAEDKPEAKKIEALLTHIEKLDAKFIRNGDEHDAKRAAEFLRVKWERADSDIKSASDFIEKLATKSSTSGKPYMIKFKDGKEVKSGEYLKDELKKIEAKK